MSPNPVRRTGIRAAASAALALAFFAACTGGAGAPPAAGGAARPVAAVETAPLRRGELVQRRTFSGTLEAAHNFTVAPRVGGRLAALHVDIGDVVASGDVVARIDEAELVQLVAQAEAELAVARANHAESVSAHTLAERALRRVESLSQQGITSESELDSARVNELARRSRIEVTAAQIQRAEAALAAARLNLGDAAVVAAWEPARGDGESQPDDRRVVGQRFVDAGGIVSVGTPLVSIVDLDPILAVVTVPERDYAHLRAGLVAGVQTDAYPGTTFEGVLERLAPVFNRSTRQVRVELVVPNRDLRLKPGMFARATLALERATDAVIVPVAALTERGGRVGVFLLDETAGQVVRWVPVETGVREGLDQEVRSDVLAPLVDSGRAVVVLGQELCDDGAPVRVIAPAGAGAADGGTL